jgi:hypothetical protein
MISSKRKVLCKLDIDMWRPTLPGYGLYDVFIWNILSLNGMRPFGGRPNTKTVRAWPKADNIILFRTGYYIWYQSHSPAGDGEACTSP